MNYRGHYLALMFLFVSISAFSQKTDTIAVSKENIKVVFKVKDDQLILRWAPANPKAWLQNPYAKVLIRKHSWIKGRFDPDTDPILISDTLTVWPESKFDKLTEEQKQNGFLMLAGYCMYAPYESMQNEKELNLKSITDRQEELTNRYSSALFAADRNVEAAKALNMYFVDDNVDLSMVNAYFVEMYTEDGEVYQDKAFYFPDENYDCNMSIDKWSEEEGMVVLSWDRKKHEKCYSSYWIERSKDNRNFTKLNKAPYVHAFDINDESSKDDFVYFDSVTNYIPYYYRIIGLDAFGEESSPSKSINLMGKDKTPPVSIRNGKAEMYLDKYMNISWEWSGVADDLDGFVIKKSQHREGPFNLSSKRQSKDLRTYKDLNPNYFGANYYQVCAIDTAQNYNCSTPIYGFILDTIPPSKPQNLIGEIDSTGIVTLTWDQGMERDIVGYNVYFANRYNGVFSILNSSPIADLQFKDTISLNSLTHNIFYKVVAVDYRSNLSKFSDMVQITKPDTIAPSAPLFIGFKNEESSIDITWVNSGSKDVKLHVLLRGSTKDNLDTIAFFNSHETKYFDQTIKPSSQYYYRLIAIDHSNNIATCPKDLFIKTSVKKKDVECDLKIDKIEGGRKILYTILEADDVEKCIIYRSINEEPFQTWKVIKDAFTGEIIDIDQNNVFDYKARIIFKSGLKSAYFKADSI